MDDAVLLPQPKRPVPLLVGTSGPQIFAASSAHIDYWNCWYAWYGNTPVEWAVSNTPGAGSSCQVG